MSGSASFLGRGAGVIVLGLVAVLASACSGGDDEQRQDSVVERTGDPTTKGSAERGELVVSPQRTDGASVVIDKVVLPKAGYVVLYADVQGAPGQQLAVSSLLQQGTSSDIVIELEEPLEEGVTMHAMLHREDNRTETLDFPEHDAPLTLEGSVIEAPLDVTVG